MRITWITSAEPLRAPDGSLSFAMASARYRVLIPIQAMATCGHQHTIVTVAAPRPPPPENVLNTDLLVFSKSFSASNEDLARRAKATGIPVIFDVCDNHYADPNLGEQYRALSRLADQVVCNTAEMARAAAPHSTSTPTVIEDPYEGPRGEPRYAPDGWLNLLWYGYESNLDSFQAALPDLLEYSDIHQPLSVVLLTQVSEQLESWCERGTAKFHRHFRMEAKPWSRQAQWGYLRACDAVLIPSLDNESKQVKSSNRLVEALWAGRAAVAQPVPAYAPFAAWTPIGPRLSDGLAWLADHASDTPGRIAAAQAYIAAHHAPAEIGRQWASVIAAVAGLRTTAQ